MQVYHFLCSPLQLLSSINSTKQIYCPVLQHLLVKVSPSCAAAFTSSAHPEAVQSNFRASPVWDLWLSGSVKGFHSPKPFKQFYIDSL